MAAKDGPERPTRGINGPREGTDGRALLALELMDLICKP